jgi:extracellular matrix protein 14
VVPWTANEDAGAPQPHNEQHASHKNRNIFPQWTWLRDTAIEKVFGLPKKSPKSKVTSASSTSQLPSNLLAKYGGDIVLRFNLSSVEEERALAEATNTLLLDVWEFTNNWADVRLREEDVSSET